MASSKEGGVSSASEAFRGFDVDEKGDRGGRGAEKGGRKAASAAESAEEMAALRRELAACKNRINDLESKQAEIGTLVQTSCLKLAFVAEKLNAEETTTTAREATKEFSKVRDMLRECLIYCGKEDVAAAVAAAEVVSPGDDKRTPVNGVDASISHGSGGGASGSRCG